MIQFLDVSKKKSKCGTKPPNDHALKSVPNKEIKEEG